MSVEMRASHANDMYAQILIVSNISKGQMVHVARYGSAIALQHGLFELRAAEGSDIVEHLTQLKQRWERLNVLDSHSFHIPDIQFKTLIASSLPSTWDVQGVLSIYYVFLIPDYTACIVSQLPALTIAVPECDQLERDLAYINEHDEFLDVASGYGVVEDSLSNEILETTSDPAAEMRLPSLQLSLV